MATWSQCFIAENWLESAKSSIENSDFSPDVFQIVRNRHKAKVVEEIATSMKARELWVG